ncbi:MAG: hypothetical protein JWQ27_3356 [Ferruginibacter sp.]|nr:hypothetical protein [Ferruginibacter sp.]
MALSSEDRQALARERFGRLKAALSLNSAQEKNWPTVESALLSAARARLQRYSQIQQVRAKSGVNLADRMRERAEGLRSRAAVVEKFAEATGPFLSSLDENQKLRFGQLLRASSRRRLEAIAARSQ